MTDVDADLLLYDSPGSPCARRVRITLAEKGLDWRTQLVDLSRLEQRSAHYLAINPNGFVPTLAHGSRVLWESNVITEYLDRVFPATPLYPADAAQRLVVKAWQAAELAMAKTFRPLMYQRLMGPIVHASRTHEQAMAVTRRSTQDPADLDWEDRVWRVAVLDADEQQAAERSLLMFCDTVEAALRPDGWLVGGGFSQAEISIYPRLAMFPLIGLALDPARHPGTLAWLEKLRRRPSFTQTQWPIERRLHAFAGSSAFRFLRRVAAMPRAKRRWFEQAGLAGLGAIVARVQAAPRHAAPFVPPSSQAPAAGPTAPPAAADIAASADAGLTAPANCSDAALVGAALAWRGLPNPGAAPGPFGLRCAGRTATQLAAAFDLIDLLATPGPRLFPDDPWAEAQVRLWLAFDASLHKEVHALEALARGDKPAPGAQPPGLCRSILMRRFDQVEARLAGQPWLCAGAMSFADAALATRLDRLAGLGLAPDAGRPALASWRASAGVGTQACDAGYRPL